MNKSVLVYKGKEIADYGFGSSHPFGVDRHDAFHTELHKAGFEKHINFGYPRYAAFDELALFHTVEHINRVSQLSKIGEGFFDDGDTPVLEGIYESASAVVGTVLNAVDQIMSGDYKRAFIPIAGLHHAARDHAAGFCVFNDCGVAIEYLRKKFGIRKIAYVDIDAHHGDGIFYGFELDPDLIFVDIHESGSGFYPGTGAAAENGKGLAKGKKLNIPIPAGADDSDFYRAWKFVEGFLEEAKPEFIIMQCGADSLKGDPIAHLCWTEETHSIASKSLCQIADKYSSGRIIGTGGGGYNRHNLARAWTRVVQSFIETNV
ncbi:MAG: acetoin utilization protein AcuC [Gammaproteobacteria bacterium]|nr:acetoin utilization protein AcuC [Gammaproteobacteria bacterium]